MNKPRPIYNRHGELIGYKQEVKWRGQRRYFTRRTAAAAEACWARAIADFEAGIEPYDRYQHERPREAAAETAVTFGEWLTDWHPKRRLSVRAERNQRIYLDTHIIPALGHLPLAADGITRGHIQEWVWSLEAEYMPRYVRTLLGVVKLALLDAVDDPAVPLDATPAVRIRMEPPDPTGRQALTPVQVAAVASRCGIHETLIWSLAFSGARVRELLDRDVTDWSWRTGIAIAGRPVEQAPAAAPAGAKRRKKGARKARATKTAAGARTIELCASHSGMIRDYVDGRTAGPLFVGRARQRATYGTVYETLGNAVEAARRAGIDVPVGVSPHWFRVTHRTWLAEAGIPRVARDDRIGHATPGMEGVYERVTPPMRAAILDALEDRWVEAMAAPGRLRRSA